MVFNKNLCISHIFENSLSARVRYYKNQRLAFKWRQLKNPQKSHLTWFWNSAVNIEITAYGEIRQTDTLTIRDEKSRWFY